MQSRRDYGIDLIAPTRADHKWQAQEQRGFDAASFQIDWEAQKMTCPAGRESSSWTPAVDRRDNQVIKVKFSMTDCRCCPVKTQCTTASRRAISIRTKEHHQALQAVRARQKDGAFWEKYRARSGIEATISEACASIWLASDSLSRNEENPPSALDDCNSDQCDTNLGLAGRRANCQNAHLEIRGFIRRLGPGSPTVSHLVMLNGLKLGEKRGDSTIQGRMRKRASMPGKDWDMLPLSTSASRIVFPSPWNIPYPRNPFFLGCDDELAQVHRHLQGSRATALSQPQAISGLGGIGKTQIAVEFAYRHRHEYQRIFWVRADTRESLVSSYISIAGLLNLPEKDAEAQQVVIRAVQNWLQTHGSWLLILDNADELALVHEFLPPGLDEHILLTTRAQVTGKLAYRIEVEIMPQDIGALFLLRRAKIIAPDVGLSAAPADEKGKAREICEKLGGLPLALDQAGAYIEKSQCSLSDYQQRFQARSTLLLKQRGDLGDDHPEPVATTWSLSFEKVEQTCPAAGELLRFCAFLTADAIPEEIITQGSAYLGTRLQSLASDPFLLDEAIGALGERHESAMSKSGTHEKD